MSAVNPPKSLKGAVLIVAALIGLWLAGSGCQTPGRAGGKVLASVVISGSSEIRIRLALVEVFEANRYATTNLYGRELVFEKEGTWADSVLRGGWLSNRTVTRAVVQVVPAGTGAYRVECRAFTVQYPGDRVMEEEYPLRSGGSFQKLLDDVKRRLTD